MLGLSRSWTNRIATSWLVLASFHFAFPALAQDDVETRLQRLEEANRSLQEQNTALQAQLGAATARFEEVLRRLESSPAAEVPTGGMVEPPPAVAAPTDAPRLPAPSLPASLLEPIATAPPPVTPAPLAPPSSASRFLVGDFDEATGQYVLVRPRDKDVTPFELRMDLWTQFRYTNFSRAREDWIDSAGNLQPVRNLNSFEIMRNWVLFTGYAYDPRLQYYLTFFSSTAFNDTTLLGWVNYQFSKGFDLRAGNWLIPGSREWYNSYRYTLGADRTMATTFFRPNISPGIWAQGEPIEGLNYVVMAADAFNRFGQTVNRVGESLTFSGSTWWEPLGAFGPGPADIEDHQTITPRFGTSFTAGRTYAQRTPSLPTNPEDTILRLSDGTPVFLPNALGPGTQVSAVDVQLWAIDAGFKYRGISLVGEYYLRRLNNFAFRTRGTPDSLDTFAQGGYLQGGFFFVPKKLQLFARHSFVNGPYGYGDEWGGGINWFVKGTRNWRFTGEVLKVNSSPADNVLTGYRAGESGTLFQVQMFTDF